MVGVYFCLPVTGYFNLAGVDKTEFDELLRVAGNDLLIAGRRNLLAQSIEAVQDDTGLLLFQLTKEAEEHIHKLIDRFTLQLGEGRFKQAVQIVEQVFLQPDHARQMQKVDQVIDFLGREGKGFAEIAKMIGNIVEKEV